ncbi:MAG: DUF86 domain-containing protein [Candidatus Moraniibacteriota bacterium]
MSTLTVIENKISSVKKYLTILEGFKKYSLEELFQDTTIAGAFERYLYLVTQSTIELGESYIAYKDFRKPTTMRESFSILKENGVIEGELEEKLSKMTSFRNALAHDYEELDPRMLFNALHESLEDIKVFLVVLQEKIQK